uniref:Uncharacterized protein n=1 Tax=Trypanosoma vivax (strain Y486) TaxID=1055687 RepID=G0TV57_TRYVY|nr:hypothetical protein, unlikely [Trypanosoma vivax Y486]
MCFPKPTLRRDVMVCKQAKRPCTHITAGLLSRQLLFSFRSFKTLAYGPFDLHAHLPSHPVFDTPHRGYMLHPFSVALLYASTLISSSFYECIGKLLKLITLGMGKQQENRK